MRSFTPIALTMALCLDASAASAQSPLISPLTVKDMESMAGGMSCVAEAGSRTLFYDDGAAIIRVGGMLVKLNKHNMVPASQYTAMGGALRVTFAKRPGKSVANEEGSRDPMTMTVIYRNLSQSVPVMMHCEA